MTHARRLDRMSDMNQATPFRFGTDDSLPHFPAGFGRPSLLAAATGKSSTAASESVLPPVLAHSMVIVYVLEKTVRNSNGAICFELHFAPYLVAMRVALAQPGDDTDDERLGVQNIRKW